MIAKTIVRPRSLARAPSPRLLGRYVARGASEMACRRIAGAFQDGPAQMIATCAHHRKDPQRAYVHLVLSWKEAEHPTAAQAFDAADHALKRLGAATHEAIFGIHRGGKNTHIHIVFSRVNPKSGALLSMWDSHKTLELACREIEVLQGWAPDNGRFDAIIDRTGPAPTVTLRRKGKEYWALKQMRRWAQLVPRQVDYDYARNRGRLPLNLRLSSRILAKLLTSIRKAADWAAVHASFATWGLEYRRSRRGAVIAVAGSSDVVSASHLSPEFSFSALHQRLGRFVARAPQGLPPLAQTEVEHARRLDGFVSDPDKALMAIPWFAKDLMGRLHAVLTGHSDIADRLSGIRIAGKEVHISLRDDGWVRTDQGGILVGASDPQKRALFCGALLGRVLGWGTRARVTQAASVPAALGLIDLEFAFGISQNTMPFGLRPAEYDALQERSEVMVENGLHRNARRTVRMQMRNKAQVTAKLQDIAQRDEDLALSLRHLVQSAPYRVTKAQIRRATDLRRSKSPLPPRDMHIETGPMLSALRQTPLNCDHPHLWFPALHLLLRSITSARPQTKSARNDVFLLTKTLAFGVHRDENQIICGFDYEIKDGTETRYGTIAGSRVPTGHMPSGGLLPNVEVTSPDTHHGQDHPSDSMP